MDRIKRILGTTIGKLVMFAAATAGILEARDLWTDHKAQADSPVIESRPVASNSPGPISRPPSGPVKEGEYIIADVFAPDALKGTVIVGSTENYTDPANVQVVIAPSVGKGKDIAIGKTLHYKGRAATYKGRPQIVATEISIK